MSRRSDCSIVAGLSAPSSATRMLATREGPVCILLPAGTCPIWGGDEGGVGPLLKSPQLRPVPVARGLYPVKSGFVTFQESGKSGF